MSLNVLLRYTAPLYHDAFVYVIDGMIILTFCLNADIEAVFLAICAFCR